MSTFVLSDIHGCSEQYHEMLRKIGFGGGDILYIVGDVIDRGPDGAELLLEIMDAGNIELIMGNHEFMMLEAILEGDYSSWTLNHCEPTMAGLNKLSQEKLMELLKFVVTRPYSAEVTVGGRLFELVHACPSGMCGDDNYKKVWNRVDARDIALTDRTVIFGHTPTVFLPATGFKPVIQHAEHAMDIDCGCVYGGRLACVRLDDMEEFYVDGLPVNM